MNETEFGRKVREHLNFGSQRLSREVATALEKARRRALATLEPEHAYAHAWPGPGGGRAGIDRRAGLRRALPVMLLLAALGAALYWQQTLMQQEEDVDSALLADELPLDAYLDHRFHAWLERSSQP